MYIVSPHVIGLKQTLCLSKLETKLYTASGKLSYAFNIFLNIMVKTNYLLILLVREASHKIAKPCADRVSAKPIIITKQSNIS